MCGFEWKTSFGERCYSCQTLIRAISNEIPSPSVLSINVIFHPPSISYSDSRRKIFHSVCGNNLIKMYVHNRLLTCVRLRVNPGENKWTNKRTNEWTNVDISHDPQLCRIKTNEPLISTDQFRKLWNEQTLKLVGMQQLY